MNNKNNIAEGFLTDTFIKENVYLLGFLWADGWICNRKFTHSVSMSLIKEDFILIEPILRNFGINCYYDRQRIQNGKIFGKISRTFTIHNLNIVNFLLNNDYDKKSGCAPTKILSIIPTNLHYYFWRGYLDGDGCISSKGVKQEVAFWSVIDQDWGSLIDLINSLGLTYSIYIYKRKNGKHNSSVLRMGGIDNIVKFGDYIYQNYDGIGLKRKYEKYLLLKEKQKIIKRKTSSHKGVFLCSRTKRWGANVYNPITKKQKHLGWFSTEINAIAAINNNGIYIK